MLKLRRWFKKYFIPHPENDHKPHLLRWEAALVILSLVLLFEILFLGALFVLPGTRFLALVLPEALVDGTNENRLEQKLPSLHTNPLLAQAAKLKAEDMAQKGYFAHTSSEGLTPWHWFSKAGYNFSYAGENLAVNFVDSEDALDAWLNSPGHRANILNGSFTEIGIATAQGTYQGREATFIVQLFGTPTAAAKMPLEKDEIKPITQIEPSPQELFVAVKNAEPAPPSGEVESVSVAARVLSTPRHVLNFLYLALATIVALALFLKIFVKIKIQHPPLIVNGALLLLIISAVMLLNQYIFLSQASIV